jgi:hypothetical protein
VKVDLAWVDRLHFRIANPVREIVAYFSRYKENGVVGSIPREVTKPST